MNLLSSLIIAAFAAVGAAAAAPPKAQRRMPTPMPAELETRFALSALPPKLRGSASVYLLDPSKGYRLATRGTSGVSCLVERTAWELGEHRDDIYIPLCYDAAGTRTYLQVKMDAAELRAQGVQPNNLKAEIERRYAAREYRAPEKPGIAYMLSPVMRTVGPPDLQVRTMMMPHVMFYAPGLTNADIGASPRLDDFTSLKVPFVDRQGNSEQSYMIQMLGAAEAALTLAQEETLVRDLCAYRSSLCLPDPQR